MKQLKCLPVFFVLMFGAFCQGEGNPFSGLTKFKREDATCAALKSIESKLTSLEKKIESVEKKIDACNSGGHLPCPGGIPKNCYEAKARCGWTKSGVVKVDPDGKGEFKVWCDQTTAGGGWTVFQQRKDGSVDFYRGWTDYRNGFGSLSGEFWLGLEGIRRLTQQTRNTLRVDLEDTKGSRAYANYGFFEVSSEKNGYQLSLGTYSGTAGDGLSHHRGSKFSTKDRDNDTSGGSCAQTYKGAWWYVACHSSNLNGLYHHGAHGSFADGVNWQPWKGYHYSAKSAKMMIRPQNASGVTSRR